jgi:NhaA family Na+:H+ antiporter
MTPALRKFFASEPSGGIVLAKPLIVCVLCGVGFTMSLFIGGLAFAGLDPSYEIRVKLGVLVGSLISGVLGALILARAGRGR